MHHLINRLFNSHVDKHPYFATLNGVWSFLYAYNHCEKRTGTKPSLWRRDRFFNLLSFLRSTYQLHGDIAELGCYRGLSSNLMLHTMKTEINYEYEGDDYHIFDSFEGLNEQMPGHFSATEEHVKEVLKHFPKVTYHKGWIPETFKNLPEKQYKFVHVDVDTPTPTIASFDYFYPRMVNGGVIVCDDYASPVWDGLKEAVDTWCKEHGVTAIPLSTCQLVILKN